MAGECRARALNPSSLAPTLICVGYRLGQGMVMVLVDLISLAIQHQEGTGLASPGGLGSQSSALSPDSEECPGEVAVDRGAPDSRLTDSSFHGHPVSGFQASGASRRGRAVLPFLHLAALASRIPLRPGVAVHPLPASGHMDTQLP